MSWPPPRETRSAFSHLFVTFSSDGAAPISSMEDPAGSMEHPISSMEDPAGSMEHPISSMEDPAGSREHPILSREDPAGSMEHPEAGNRPAFFARSPLPT